MQMQTWIIKILYTGWTFLYVIFCTKRDSHSFLFSIRLKQSEINTEVPSITDSFTPFVKEWNHVFPGAADDACKSWLLNLAARAIMATAVTSGFCLKHSVVDKLKNRNWFDYYWLVSLLFTLLPGCRTKYAIGRNHMTLLISLIFKTILSFIGLHVIAANKQSHVTFITGIKII